MLPRLKTIAPSLIFIILLSFLFVAEPKAEAATNNSNQVFESCFIKGTTKIVSTHLLQAAINLAVSAVYGTTATIAATGQAIVSVPTTNPSLSGTTGALAGEQTASNVWQDDVKPYADAMSYLLAQCTLQQFTANTINWIKGGFHGSPSFSINPSKTFLDLESSIANQVSRQSMSATFLSGFDNSLSKAIQLSTRVDANGKFSARLEPSFPPGVTPSRFYNDFSQGGWDAFSSSLSDRNNPYGRILIVDSELGVRQATAKDLQQQQLAWSHGFIDLVDLDNCFYPYGDTAGPYVNLVNGQPDPAKYTPAEISSLQKQYCTITTPGSIISDQLTKTLGTDMDRLGLADDFNKIITVLISTLVQDTVKHVF